MVTCCKKEQVVSELKRKNFTGEFKAKVALEAIRGVKTVNEIGQQWAGVSVRPSLAASAAAISSLHSVGASRRPLMVSLGLSGIVITTP